MYISETLELGNERYLNGKIDTMQIPKEKKNGIKMCSNNGGNNVS